MMLRAAPDRPVRTVEEPRALDLGTATGAQGGNDGPLQVPLQVPLSVFTGQVLVTGGASEVSHVVARLLGQLNVAGIPWLRVGRLPVRADHDAPATVVDLTDPHGIPLTVDPLQPVAGYPTAAHASALCALLAAAFSLPDSFRDILALALRRIYAAYRVTGEAGSVQPAAQTVPAPTLRQLERAAVDAARALGHPEAMEATVRGFVRVRLGELCGPATGLLLGGGHPVDTAELVRGNVDVVTGDLGGGEGRALLAGAVALRVAEHACQFSRVATADLPRHVMVLEEAGLLFSSSRALRQLERLLGDAAVHGAGVILTEHGPTPVAPWLARSVALTITHEPGAAVVTVPALSAPVAVDAPPAAARATSPIVVPSSRPAWEQPASRAGAQPGARPGVRPGSLSGLVGRRWAGCGLSCRAERPCTREEIGAATTLAETQDSPAAAWERLWIEILVLAFLTGRPLPAPPPHLRAATAARRARVRECVLAALAERAVTERVPALGGSYPAASLARAASSVATAMLAGQNAPRAAGQVWVIPQLRWAHEASRVGWTRGRRPGGAEPRGTVRPDDLAPPLDFALAGLHDWTGITAGDRLRLLLRHSLSLAAEPNRELAAAALFGERGQLAFEAGLAADLALVLPCPSGGSASPSSSPQLLTARMTSRLSEATRLMGYQTQWLVSVLRWTGNG